MTKPKNMSCEDWRKKCNERYAGRRDHVAALNRKLRVKDPIRFMYNEARKRAKKSAVPFDIEISDIFVPTFCPMLGITLAHGPGLRKFEHNSPSLDRIHNELGYVKGNVRVISDLANRMKRNATAEQLRVFALSILVEQGFLGLKY